MVKALADRFAEALAEKIHEQARRDAGFGKQETLEKQDLIRERYRGIRPAPGYPASPDHSEKATLFSLLDAEKNVGVELTENFAMFPAASVSGLYFNHPQAKYFSVGKIGKDQAEDYASRKRAPRERSNAGSGRTSRTSGGGIKKFFRREGTKSHARLVCGRLPC